MANAPGIDLTGKVVVLSPRYYHGDERARRFLCWGGFGCLPHTNGKAVHGRFLCDGEECRVEGYQIEKLSDDQRPDVESPGRSPARQEA